MLVNYKQMNRTTTTERTLSKNESRVILDFEWRGQRTVTLTDLRTILGCSETYARYLAHQLVRKGWLERLRPGLFRLIPAERGREGIGDTNPLTAGAALVHPYFFSFGTACTHYGFTEQVFTEIYIACRRRLRPRMLRNMRYVFVDLREDRFFGFAEANVLSETVQMATRERAILDAIERPRLAGGLGEVSRMVSRSVAKLSWSELLDLLCRWGESALVQRLGYLLDLHQIDLPAEHRYALMSLVRSGSKVHLGPRGKWGASGKLVGPWNVVENVPREVLIEKGEQKRRRVTFESSRSNS
jgi:predicted transcriptional regulator of viral defense system